MRYYHYYKLIVVVMICKNVRITKQTMFLVMSLPQMNIVGKLTLQNWMYVGMTIKFNYGLMYVHLADGSRLYERLKRIELYD